MSKPAFVTEITAITATYNASAQGTEDKQTYLADLSAATKAFTGVNVPQATTWPC